MLRKRSTRSPDRTADEDADFSYVIPSNTFRDIDAGEQAQLTYEVRLANGQAKPGWLNFDAATRTLSGKPTNDDVATYQLVVIAKDPHNATATSNTFKLTVNNVNDKPVTVQAIGPRTAEQGTKFEYTMPAADRQSGAFYDIDMPYGDALSYTANLLSGDQGAETLAALPGWLTFDAATGKFSGTPRRRRRHRPQPAVEDPCDGDRQATRVCVAGLYADSDQHQRSALAEESAGGSGNPTG